MKTAAILATLLLASHAATAQQLDMLSATVRLHLESGNDVNQIIETEGTLLQAAIKSYNGALAKLLIEAGADTNLVSDADDQPPLTLAIRLDDLEVLSLLIENGADIDGEDSEGRTPLFKTLRPDRSDTRIFLIENGADVNKSLHSGTTAIVEATSIRNVNAINQLVANNATINAKLVSKAACDYCHISKGRDLCENPGTPSLAGQHSEYIAKQLGDYHNYARKKDTKDVLSNGLVDKFNLALGAYYEGLPRHRNMPTGSPQLQAKGKITYDVNCSSCHGVDGIKTQNKLTPTLAGLNSMYVSSQMRAYKTGERANDADSVMRNISAELTREQIFEVSEYIQSLY